MGTARKKVGTAKPSGSMKKPPKAVTATQLFDQAREALAFDDVDRAKTCFQKALQLEPDNAELVDAYGALLAEIGPPHEALLVLQKAVELSPESGFEKYMYLGQLTEAEEGVAHLRKGVALLRAGGSAMCSEAEEAAGPEQLSSALCALAEKVMSSCSGLPAVAEEVESLLQEAHALAPSSPEPLQALASLRYEQERPEEALDILRRSMSLWYKPSTSDNDESDEDEEMRSVKKHPTEVEEEEELPSFEFRFECAKLLLELDESTEAAIDVLEGLLEENDSVPDVWHLAALAYYSGHEYDEAEQLLEGGMKLLQQMAIGPQEELAVSFADLKSAISEAKQAAAGGST